MLRYSTVAVAQQAPRSRKWLWTGAGVAATAGVAALTASSSFRQHEQDATPQQQQQQHPPATTLAYLQQQLSKAAAAVWPSRRTSRNDAEPSSLADSAINHVRATSARWLAQWAEDPEAREALLAFGSDTLLDFLITTATDDPSPEQAHAEQALCNFLRGHHTSTRLLSRPGAISRLLNHVAGGKASEGLVEGLSGVLRTKGVDLSRGLSVEDGRELIGMLDGGQGDQVQGLSLQYLTSLCSAGGAQQCQQLADAGLAIALGHLAMEAVQQGEHGRQLQKAVCRCQRALLTDPSAVDDRQLATWMQPLLFMAADAAAAAAAAAATAGGRSAYAGLSNGSSGSSSGGGVLGLPAGAADLAVADVAMTTLGAAVAAGGPQVKAALRDLHVVPTLDCLALSNDSAIRARAAAALATLVTAGHLEFEEASGRWTDMLLSWLVTSTANGLKKPAGSSSGSSSSSGGWFGSLMGGSSSSSDGQGSGSSSSSSGGMSPSDEALARSCVAALRALSQQPGPVGLSVAQQWLAKLLLQLSNRVAAYTTITTLAAADGSSSSSSRKAAAALRAAGAVALADAPAISELPSNKLIREAAAAVREAGSSSSSEEIVHDPDRLVVPDTGAAATDQAGSSSSSSWWWLGSRWWPGISQDTSNNSNNTNNMQNNMLPDDLWAQLESAREAAWRDAAPVTAASAKAAAEDLRAASNALVASWRATTTGLALPSDLVPGMFVAAVEEAYPAASRVMDCAVAQQRTVQVLEILASVVAEDPVKQSWLLAAGILPLMDRLVLHEDAAFDPQTFVDKYSNSSSSGVDSGGSKSSRDGDQAGNEGSSSSSSSGRLWWWWWGSGSGAAETEAGGSSSSKDGSSSSAAGTESNGSSSSKGGSSSSAAGSEAGGSSTTASSTDPHSSSGGSSTGGIRPDPASQAAAAVQHVTAAVAPAAAPQPVVTVASPLESTMHWGQFNARDRTAEAATAMHNAQHDYSLSGPRAKGCKETDRERMHNGQGGSSSSGSSSNSRRKQTAADQAVDSSQCTHQRWKHVLIFACAFGHELDAFDASDCVGRDQDTAAAAAGATRWLAHAVASRFTAAAQHSSISSSTDRSSSTTQSTTKQAAVDADGDLANGTVSSIDQALNSSSSHGKVQATDQPRSESAPPAAAAAAAQESAKQAPSNHLPSTVLVGFAQGAASWDIPSKPSHSQNPRSTLRSDQNPKTPKQQPTLDTATALTAAAEAEGSSWSDGEGLGLLLLQRQVARILSMLALQPEAAWQLAESAIGTTNGAVGVLEDLGVRSGLSDPVQIVRSDGSENLGRPDLSRSAIPADLLNPGKKGLSRGRDHGGGSSSSSSYQWLPWLLAAAASDDCLLSSYATVALLHLESAVAHQIQQQQQLQHFSQLGSSSSSNSSRWKQRLAQELQAAEEDIAALIEEFWPFSSTLAGSSSGDQDLGDRSRVWRPPIYYPDGIHLINPSSDHHWGLLQPPRATLLESLGTVAANAAATAAAAAASDLAQSEIEGPAVPAAADGAAAADMAAAAAEAAAAAASAFGADVSQLSQLQHDGSSSSSTASSGSSDSNGGSSSSTDLGMLQPAIIWLAQKLVKLAALKQEQVQEQQQQQQRGPHGSSSSNPAVPLSTYSAVHALLTQLASSSSSGSSKVTQPAPVAPEQQAIMQHSSSSNSSSSSVQQLSHTYADSVPAPQPPDYDVIFIHGIRGGPFVTWRRGGTHGSSSSTSSSKSGSSAAAAGPAGSSDGVVVTPAAAISPHQRHMTQADCWPAAWLAADLPGARILSVEYKAPVTGWEGESLSLPDSGRVLLDKLVAAGVGQRPVVFVAHSMGGLVVKEMLSQSLKEPPSSSKGRLASATRAIAFYSTPHFGSSMAALGWKLRHLPGASPAPSIHHLSPGPHLSALNARLALLHESGRVQVLSFTEGLATSLAGLGFLPKILIVPYESAYPGFGEVCVLADRDHIDVCKPDDRDAPAYSKLLEFLKASIDDSCTANSEGTAGDCASAGARVPCGGDDADAPEDIALVSSA